MKPKPLHKENKFTHYLKQDLIVILVLPILATSITVVFKTSLLTSIILFFGLPSAYIALRNRPIFRKSFAFSFLLSVPLSLFIDALAAVNGSWVVPVSVFPFRFFGVATAEVYLYGLLWVLFAVLFYEHFLDKPKKTDSTSPRIKYLVYISLVLVLYSVVAFFLNRDLLYVPYFYLVSGIFLVLIPLILFLFEYPVFARRYLILGIYFFVVLLLFEIAALYANQWIFPAKDFVGFVNFFGFRFPLEELIIWMVAATAALLSYYEFFDDDRK